MAFIHMVNRRLYAESFQCPDPTYAQQYFLLYPGIMVSAVQSRSDMPVLLNICRNIRIKQVKIHDADLYLPYRSIDSPSGQLHAYQHRLSIFTGNLGDRELAYVKCIEGSFLKAIMIYPLIEIALPVEQAHPCERDAEITGGFTMIAGQHAEPARINGQRLAEAVFCGEICHHVVAQFRICRAEPCIGTIHVRVEFAYHIIICIQKALIIRQLLQPSASYPFNKSGRVSTCLFPESRIRHSEHFCRTAIPGPPEIACDVPEPGKPFRYHCWYGYPAYWSH